MCHAGHDSMIVLEMLTYLDTMATPRFTAHGRERFQAPSPCILVLFTVLFEMGTPAKSIRQSQWPPHWFCLKTGWRSKPLNRWDNHFTYQTWNREMVYLNVLTFYIQKWPSHHGTGPHWRHPKNWWSAPEPNPSRASACDDFRHIYRRWLILNFQKQNNMQCNTVCNMCRIPTQYPRAMHKSKSKRWALRPKGGTSNWAASKCQKKSSRSRLRTSHSEWRGPPAVASLGLGHVCFVSVVLAHVGR